MRLCCSESLRSTDVVFSKAPIAIAPASSTSRSVASRGAGADVRPAAVSAGIWFAVVSRMRPHARWGTIAAAWVGSPPSVRRRGLSHPWRGSVPWQPWRASPESPMSFLDRLSDVSALLCCGPEASGSFVRERGSFERSVRARGAFKRHRQFAPPRAGTAIESGAAHPTRAAHRCYRPMPM